MFDKLKKNLGLGNNEPVVELTSTEYFRTGKLFPPPSHRERLDRYKRNREIFKGNNLESIKNFNGSKQKQELLYVSANLAGVICKKSADFLFGESISVIAGNGEKSKEQLALNRFALDSGLNILNYESALSNAYRGDSFIKVRYGQEFAGEVPKELDPHKVIIESANPETIFPETSLHDKNKISAYHIAVPVKVSLDGKEAWQLFIESHYAGRIENRVFNLEVKDMEYNGSFAKVTLWKIADEILSARSVINTGVAIPLVVHIPNYATDESWEGIDDITEHIPLLEEINARLTQISSILTSHADPAMVVPAGVLGEDMDGNPLFNVQRDKVFEVMGKDDVVPQYITWEGQLSHAFKELETLLDLFLMAAEIPGVAIGRGGDGTSGTSGLAIKWRMNSLLGKINRKRQYYDRGLKKALWIAQQLEDVIGIADYTPLIPKLEFKDGLPQDNTEQATIMSIRTGGMKTLSQKSAIMRLEDMTEDQAELEVARIEEEQKKELENQATVDTDTLFNAPTNKDVDKNKTEKHAEGNPVTDKAKVKK